VPGSAGYAEFENKIPAEGHRAFSWNIIRGDEKIAYISNDKVILCQTSNIQQILAFPYFDEAPMGSAVSPGDDNIPPAQAAFRHNDTKGVSKYSSHSHFKGKIPKNFHRQPLKLISFCNDRIIAVSSSFIFIFANVASCGEDLGTKTTSHIQSHWELEQILEVDFPVECISTNRFGDRFIVGGTHCQMFRYRNFSKGQKHWRSVWKEPMPNPVRFIHMSPDDRLFATLSDTSVPLVKIWYKSFSTKRHNQNYEHYSFLYLKHNKPIIRMEWRSKEIMESDMPNVLMTYSEDSVQRFWMETSLREELHFFICHSTHKPNVHAIHFLCAPHELSPNEVIMQHAITKRIDVGDAGHQDIFSPNDVAISTSSGLSETSLRHHVESQSWLLTIYKDGTVEIEMVCGLADLPRRTPTVTVWSRLPKVFEGGHQQLMMRHQENFVFYSCSEQPSNSSGLSHIFGAPSLITIYSQSTEGQITNYSLNLTSGDQCVPNIPLPPKLPLHLNSILTGHHHAISKIVAHSRLPLAATYDPQSQQLLLWHIRDSAYFSPQDILTHIYTLNNVVITDFSFSLTQPALFISTPKGIEILYIKSQKPKSYVCLPEQETDPIQSMDSSQKAIFPPLPAYYSIMWMDPIEDSEDFALCSYLRVLPAQLESDDSEDVDSPRNDASPSTNGNSERDSILLVTLSRDKAELAVWKVSMMYGDVDLSADTLTAPEPSFVSKHIAQQVLSEDVSCIDCESTLTLATKSEDGSSCQHHSSIVVAVGTSDGHVHMYKSEKKPPAQPARRGGLLAKFASSSSNDDDSLKFMELLNFQAEDGPIQQIKCCEFVSRIVTCPADGKHVTIYESESQNSFTKEQRIIMEASECVTQLEWYTFGDGEYILTVGSNENVRCFSEGKMDLHSSSDTFWEQMAILQRLKTSQPCTGITITKERTIIAAFGKNIHVYTKWLHNDEIDGFFEDHYLTRVRKKHRRLPDYHPKLLEDLLMAGDFDVVRDVFIHLAHHVDQNCNKSAHREEDQLYVPLLPVYCFKSKEEKEQKKPAAPTAPQKRATLLDRFKSVSLTDSDDDEEEDLPSTIKPQKDDEKDPADTLTFVQKETSMDFVDAYKILVEWVPKIRLPELSGIDQMNLMGILDTFHRVQQKPEALDDAAIRFFVACTNAQYLQKANKSVQIKSAHKAWMMQSETQETLIRLLNLQGKLTWKTVQYLGIPYWMNSMTQLHTFAQQMARDRYAEKNRDPSSCALIYLALGKKSTLIQLYKTVGEEKIAKFLQRDFDPDAPPDSPERNNCVLAARNAYKLIGQHKFEYAAAFFLLSGSIKDTMDILVRKVDILMAYFILRLVRGDDHEDTKAFLYNYLIPYTRDSLRDPWLTSIALWRCRDYEESLRVLCHERGSLKNFDASLFAYCEKIESKTQLANSSVFSDCRKSVLLQVSHYFMHTGAIVLALENLKLFKSIADESGANSTGDNAAPSSQMSSQSESAVMSGMVDLSSFGMGMMGGSGGMGMLGGGMMGGNFGNLAQQHAIPQQNVAASSASDGHSTSNAAKNDNMSARTLTRLLKFKMALLLMTQELDDLALKPTPSPKADWELFQSRIDTEITHLIESFHVDKEFLKIKLKEYSKLNGHLLSRCILMPDKNIVSNMQSVVYQVVSLLSKMYQTKLSRAHIQMIRSFTREFVLCYERCELTNVRMSDSQRADFGAALFSVLFISAWSRNDFACLQILLTLPGKMHTSQKDSSDDTPTSASAFYDTLMYNLPEFYHTYVLMLKKAKQDEELERELAENEEKSSRKYFYGAKSPKSGNTPTQRGTSPSIARSKSNLGIKSEQSAQVLQIKQNYYDVVFETVLLSEFVENIKMLLHNGYAGESGNSNEIPYSIAARTIISSLSLWYSIMQDKLQYKQLELYAATNQLPTRGFRDVATLSFARSHSPLSNLVKTLVFSARQSHKRRSSVHTKMLKRNRTSITDFHSLVHAIPELTQGKESSSRTNLLQLLDDVPLGDIVFSQKQQEVWETMKRTALSTIDLKLSTEENVATPVAEGTTASTTTPFVFSEAIEIVKCKEPIKAFCIDRSQPQILTFATSKLIREINVEHSIRYRKRNPSLDKLLDEEMPTWDQSLHQFDQKNMIESPVPHLGGLSGHMSQRSVETLAGFMNPIEDIADEEEAPCRVFSLQGMGSHPYPSRKSLWKRTAKKIKRAHRVRRPSFTTTSSNVSMHQFRPSKQHSQAIDHRVSVSVMVAHPFLPFYLSGGYDGSLYLWQYQQEHPVRIYKQPGNPAITNIKFGQFGYKFGASNDRGHVLLWRFDSNKDSLQEFDKLHCHLDRTADFTFLNSGSVIATIGTSNSVKELCIWDVLLPQHESIIAKEILDEDPSSITYASHCNCLIIGCKKGEILIYSVSEQKFLSKILVDDRNIETICVDTAEDFFVVGCSDGHCSVYDMNTFEQMYVFKHEHNKRGGLFNIGDSGGVTQAEVVDEFLYSSGADGRIVRRSFHL